MAERPQFGDTLPRLGKRAGRDPAALMFPDGEDLPLFSGTAISANDSPFVPEQQSMRQAMLPGMPPIDYAAVLARDRSLYRHRPSPPMEDAILLPMKDVPLSGTEPGTIFSLTTSNPVPDGTGPDVALTTPDPVLDGMEPHVALPLSGAEPHVVSMNGGEPQPATLRDALAPYVDLGTLRDLAATGEDIRASFRLNGGELPEELAALFATIKVLLRPPDTYQIKTPSDLAAYLMLDMGFLDQEQLKVACLNTKGHLQKVHLVYQGSLNSSLVRVGEVFREPIKLNSAAVIIAHNHPSSDPTPSPEDVMVTKQIVTAGILLDIDVLDHVIIGQGRWISMRQRNLGFNE